MLLRSPLTSVVSFCEFKGNGTPEKTEVYDLLGSEYVAWILSASHSDVSGRLGTHL